MDKRMLAEGPNINLTATSLFQKNSSYYDATKFRILFKSEGIDLSSVKLQFKTSAHLRNIIYERIEESQTLEKSVVKQFLINSGRINKMFNQMTQLKIMDADSMIFIQTKIYILRGVLKTTTDETAIKNINKELESYSRAIAQKTLSQKQQEEQKEFQEQQMREKLESFNVQINFEHIQRMQQYSNHFNGILFTFVKLFGI